MADLDLEIPTGSVVGIIGPSGSGKTTTIRMITGSLALTSGTIAVLGQHPGAFSRRTRELMGYMPQQFSLPRFRVDIGAGSTHIDINHR
ncbi:MAG TPA: ATP-binding cassette domain-containing protein [Candidatus Dormibacteraeota bacterium]|nr:ATP-binding cassette domain-containing protein [Candidatus Dormibacteraeota bacterium]